MDTEALKKSLLKKFQEVTADRLQKIQLGVIDLEKETADQAADDVARELHTMKGEARMLGLAAIGQLAHAAEDVLRAEREGKTATETATDVMLRACDVLSDLIEDLDAAHTGSTATEEMVKALSEVSGHPVPALGPVRKPAASSAPRPPRRRPGPW
ncbi:Hpt domain-containing protein, partial [Corallococcus sp. CA053C]|uniref:Hpt domain-containing protein n=1 Tax=Corallococcus sp. CA053C TaxID=2316732 RepID=UPI001F42097D